MKKHLLAACVLLCMMIAVAYAGDPVKDRIDSLENSIKQFQADSVARNQKVASALETVERIKQEYQSILGTLEANSHMIQQQMAEIQRLKRDLYDRMNAIDDRLEIYDQQITKAVSKISPASANETEAYQKGLDQVQKGDFLTAVASFRSFLRNYPKSDLSDNAQYWIGECYFALKDYPKAIKEFQSLIEKYPKSAKAPSAILKQGYAFIELGMYEDGKTFLNKVINGYPSTEEASRAREKLNRVDQKNATEASTSQAVSAQRPDANNNVPLAPGLKLQQQKAVPADEKTSDMPPQPKGNTR